MERPYRMADPQSALPAFSAHIADMTSRLRRTLIGLVLFGIAFGYVEAAVVVYLRDFTRPIRRRLLPQSSPDELFPLLSLDRLRSEAPDLMNRLPVEVLREAATILMLAAVALLVVADREVWLAAFAVVFGVWDLSFYLFLKLLIHWPDSLFTWDILFLIPVPWVAPVLAPVVVAATIAGCGLAALLHRPRLTRLHWGVLILANALVLFSFTADYKRMMAGEVPQSFAWMPFIAGEALGLAAFLHATRRLSSRDTRE